MQSHRCSKSRFLVDRWAPLLFLLAALPILSTANAQEQHWFTRIGTSGSDRAGGLTPDGAGGVYVGGETGGVLGTMHFGSADGYICRYDSTGNLLWMQQHGSRANDYANALAPDDTGGVYVAGTTGGDVAVKNIGAYDVLVSRYDSAGTRLWVKQFGTPQMDNAMAAAPDGAGGVIIGGNTSGDMGGPPSGSTADGFLARYNGAGEQLWLRQFGTPDSDLVYGLEADGARGVFVTGITLGDLSGPSLGGIDGFVARFDASGNEIWVKQFGTAKYDYARAITSDGAGGVIIAGETAGSLGGPNTGYTDIFITRYDGQGNQLWMRQHGTEFEEGAYAIASDGKGGVMVAGESWTDAVWPAAEYFDIFVAHFDSSGNELWMRKIGTSENEQATAVVNDGRGGALIAGWTLGDLLGPSAGGRDAFLTRYEIDSCYADCDKSTGNGVLDIFDFLCFQNSFVNGEPYACDCDTSTGVGVCDVFDFLCFQNAFVAGCP